VTSPGGGRGPSRRLRPGHPVGWQPPGAMAQHQPGQGGSERRACWPGTPGKVSS